MIGKWGRLYATLRRIERQITLLARAQCRIAGISHPADKDAMVEEPDVLTTDRDRIAEIREKARQDLIYGIHEE